MTVNAMTDLEKDNHDFSLDYQGNISLLRPQTPEAQEWIDTHLPEERLMWGWAVVIEHRYVEAILEGLEGNGLTVSGA